MAALCHFGGAKKVFFLYLVLTIFASVFLCAWSDSQLPNRGFLGRRRMLANDKEDLPTKKPTAGTLSAKNQTKLVKPSLPLKNQIKLVQTGLSNKNHTKLVKPGNSSKTTSILPDNIELKKLNVSPKPKKLNSTSKASNSTKISSSSISKSPDLLKPKAAKNKTTKPTPSTKQSQVLLETKLDEAQSQKADNSQKSEKKSIPGKPKKRLIPASWIDDDDDLVTEFRELPTKFQKTLIPDLEKFSTTSKAYITQANKRMTKGFKPLVGTKYAAPVASVVSFAFILVPLLLVSLIFNRIKAYFSLQKLLIFIQVYLSIYFSILCLSSLITGLDPLKFFYATSHSSYVCVQVLQTLGYVLYLLLLLMYLILVFSTDCGLAPKALGLAQTFMGFAVGLHYYMAVFHRMVLHQPPKTNWKVHGIYATCFFVICLFAGAERRKKAYLEDGGEEGKKS